VQAFRLQLVKMSILYSGAIGVFCLIAPFLHYPLEFPDESIKVLQLILPVFIGFLVAGVRFYTTAETIDEPITPRVVTLTKLLQWSFSLFTVLTVTVFLVFGLSATSLVSPRRGMDIDQLTLLLSLLLTLLTGTVGAMVTFAFPSTTESQNKRKGG
jgi:hypothetical protein